MSKAGTHLGKVHEMLEACIEMSLFSQAAYTPEMCVVDMRIHPEQALKHGPHYIHEVGWEWYTILLWKDPGVIHLHGHVFSLINNVSGTDDEHAPAIFPSCMLEAA